MSMIQQKIDLAASILEITPGVASVHHVPTGVVGVERFWSPIRGGHSVLIDDSLEFLVYTSAVGPDAALEEWQGGRRTLNS